MIIVDAPSSIDAWKQASIKLTANSRELYNLIVSFPCAAETRADLERFNPRRVLGPAFDSIFDVANTLFPSKIWEKVPDRDTLYARYAAAHRRARRKSWGTYFLRLISFGEQRRNQLEEALHVLTAWKPAYRAAIQMHISSPDTDRMRGRGGPCLQYLQITRPAHAMICLTAVYRNHDFTNKALGNYIGLCRVLRFLAEESGLEPGTVTCHSAHAYVPIAAKRQSSLTAQ